MTPTWIWTVGEFVLAIFGVLRLAAWMRCECLFTSGVCRYRCSLWGWQAIVAFALATLCHFAPALAAWIAGRLG